MAVIFLSVDLQNDFAAEGGAHYCRRSCVPFIREELVPFVRERKYRLAEIISDYRTSGQGDGPSVCAPGSWGYESIIPADIKHPSVWVKSAPSPAWIREGAGKADCPPGEPYHAPDEIGRWLSEAVGPPSAGHEIVLIGLVLEVCVISTLQELHYRGYRAGVLFEGVDTGSGLVEQKTVLFETLFPFWGTPVYWDDLKNRCGQL